MAKKLNNYRRTVQYLQKIYNLKNTNINATLKELKEYNDMMKALKAEIEKLQDECKEYMIDNNVDEVISNDGIKAPNSLFKYANASSTVIDAFIIIYLRFY